MAGRKLRILGRTLNSGGARWLRMEQHLDVLSRQGLADCGLVRASDDPDLVAKAAVGSDVFVSSASAGVHLRKDGEPMSQHWLRFVKSVVTEVGIPWIWDVDDDHLNVNPFNQAYGFYGLEEVEIEDARGRHALWKDGRGGFDLARNRATAEAYVEILRTVTALTTTTKYMREKLLKYNPNVYLRPNVFDFEGIWKKKSRPSLDGCVRILYAGGASHFMDLESVLPALVEIARDYPQTRFIFLGDVDLRARSSLPAHRVLRFPWTRNYLIYAKRMQALRADIGIAPLSMEPAYREFNRSKSPIKWLDYAAIGLPSVCQAGNPYCEVVNFGRGVPGDCWNGLLAETPEDWYDCLVRLIENGDMRRTLGANAYEEAVCDWNVAHWGPIYLRQYEEVVGGHHDTEAAA